MQTLEEKFHALEDLTKGALDGSKYDKIVSLCRDTFRQVKEYKIRLGGVAHYVCDISHGGHLGRVGYSLTQFAVDIGVRRSTLWRWRKEFLILKRAGLEDSLKGEKVNRSAIDRILNKINDDTSSESIKKLYNDEIKRGKDELTVLDHIKRIKTIAFSCSNEIDFTKVDEAYTRALKDLLKSSIDGIDNFQKRHSKKEKRDFAMSKAESVKELLEAGAL